MPKKKPGKRASAKGGRKKTGGPAKSSSARGGRKGQKGKVKSQKASAKSMRKRRARGRRLKKY